MKHKNKIFGVLLMVIAFSATTTSSAQANFTSAAYPASVAGSSSGDVFSLFGSTGRCVNTGWNLLFPAPSSTATITPKAEKCTFFGFPATVNYTGCDYLWHHTWGPFGTQDLVCPAGKKVDVSIYSSSAHAIAICHVNLEPYSGKSGLSFATSGNHINVTGTISGIRATQSRTSFLCPGTEESSAKYMIQEQGITLSGNNGAISVD